MNPNSVSIYQSLAQVSDNNDFLKNHASKDINNQSLKSMVERQPLFQLLSLNQRANSLIKNKTSFLTNSAKCFSQPNDLLAPPQPIPATSSPPVSYSSNNSNSNNIPAGLGKPQPRPSSPVCQNALPCNANSQFHQQPAKLQHYNHQQQHHLNDEKQKFNYQRSLRHYSSNGNFNTCSSLDSVGPFDTYAPPRKVDLNIQSSPIDFANSIWCPTHNNNSSLSVNSVPTKSVNNYSSLPTFMRTEIDDSWSTSKSNNNSISTGNASNYFDSSFNDANSLSIGNSRYGNGHNNSISSGSSISTSFQDSIFDQGIQETSSSFYSPVNTSNDFAYPISTPSPAVSHVPVPSPTPIPVSASEMGNDFTNYSTFDKNMGSSYQGRSLVNTSTTNPSAHDHQKIISPANLKLPINARFFVIKSSNLHDIQQAYYNGTWSSTGSGNRRLHSAYLTNCPIYLLFSVNGSKQFCGIAQMCSDINYTNTVNGSNGKETWQESSNKCDGFFRVQFLFVKDVSFQYFKDLTLANNYNKSVTNSRDTQEIPISVAAAIVEIFTNTPSNSCFLV